MIRHLRLPALSLLTAPALLAAEAPPVQISVQCEWIRLPHAAANALIRQHLKSAGSTALHDAVSAMLKDKTASRLDVQSLLTCAGQRAKVEGTTGKAFATSFDEVVVTLFLAGPEQATLPRQMFSGIRENLSPTIAAAATLLIAFSVILLLTLEWLRGRSEKLRTAQV